MQKMAKGAIVLLSSTICSWIGALLDHNNWWSAPSIVLGIIGLGLGYWLARALDNYISG